VAQAQPKFDSLSRLAHLEGIAADKLAAGRELGERIRAVSDELKRARQRLDHLELDQGFSGIDVERQVNDLKGRVAALEASKADLTRRYDEIGAARVTAARTYERAKARAEELGLPIPLTLGAA
jgi:predicted  nucleic acid-binding Zn-ribbon protein